MNDLALEVWRRVDFLPYIEVSDLGNIRTYTQWHYRLSDVPRPMKTQLYIGYRCITARNALGKRTTFKVAALVLHAFVGPRPAGLVVAHENGTSGDDRLANLSYKTQKENIHDKFRHGTMMAGEAHTNHKLTVEAVRLIKYGTLGTMSAAKTFDVSHAAIWAIRTNKTWKTV